MKNLPPASLPPQPTLFPAADLLTGPGDHNVMTTTHIIGTPPPAACVDHRLISQITAFLNHDREENANEGIRSPPAKRGQAETKQNLPTYRQRFNTPHRMRGKGFNTPQRTEQIWAFPFHRRGNEGLPGVPSRAALAPAKVRRPPSLRCLVARWLEMVEVHMLCFHIRSQFLKRAERKKPVCQLSIHSEETERWAHVTAPGTQGSNDSHCCPLGPCLQGLMQAAQRLWSETSGSDPGHVTPWVSASSPYTGKFLANQWGLLTVTWAWLQLRDCSTF